MKTVLIWIAPVLLAFVLYGAHYAVFFVATHPDWLP
jgi:hypothetical protein